MKLLLFGRHLHRRSEAVFVILHMAGHLEHFDGKWNNYICQEWTAMKKAPICRE